MIITGNTILITGGGSGIGRGLAEAFQAAGNRVIITGRRREVLEETVAANPGMSFQTLDVEDPVAIRAFAAQIVRDFPGLNVLINNAGIMRPETVVADPVDLSVADATITTNLLGPLRMTAALLPHLRKQPKATIINVTSGLAFVPRFDFATYCATKAALHSSTQSLRHELRKTSVEVLELAPPLVATDLKPGQREDPRAMPLADFINESMALLKVAASPEILVERVRGSRNAEATGRYSEIYALLNPQ
jgi:uncharacterized oxidoreductase